MLVEVSHLIFKSKYSKKILEKIPVDWNMNFQTTAMATIVRTTGRNKADWKIFLKIIFLWNRSAKAKANIIINITEPLLRPVRELIFQFNSSIDISPIITIFILNSLKSLLISSII